MKKITTLFFLFVLILGLTACQEVDPVTPSETATESDTAPHTNLVQAEVSPTYDDRNNSPADVLDAFSKFLDKESFLPDMDIKEALKNRYRYRGQDLYSQHLVRVADMANGQSTSGNADHFSFEYIWTLTEDLKNVSITNHFSTEVPLDGIVFKLPYKIKFEDPLASALQKLGIEKGVADFVADETGAMTLLQNETDTLNWTVYEPEKIYSHQLKYEQVYQRTRSDGKIETVTRRVSLYFKGEENTLCKVELYVNQNYPQS